jgi:phosphate transport system substrate-binding protein
VQTGALSAPGILLLVPCILVLCSACTPQPVTVTREPVTLRLVAADSCAPLVEDVATTYEGLRPWVRVSTDIFNAALAERILREGGADLALLSWLGEPEGDGRLWTEDLARDGVAVIVHPASPLTGTGLTQLREIFRGRLQEQAGILLTVVSREDGSGTRALLESVALDGEGTTLNAVVMPSSEAMVEHVANTPGAIGYVSTLWLGPTQTGHSGQGGSREDRVRVLPVEGLLPTEQTIGDGSFPLWRQLYLASSGEPDGEAREFAQWLLQGGGMGDSGALTNR